MANTKFRSQRLKRGQPASIAYKYGYQSARAGASFDSRFYEKLPMVDASNYEKGRLLALETKHQFGYAPEWRNTVKGIPDTCRATWDRLDRSAPLAHITRVIMPEDPDLNFTRPHLNRRGFPNPIPTYCTK